MTIVFLVAIPLIVIGWLYANRTKGTLISNDERKEIEKARLERIARQL